MPFLCAAFLGVDKYVEEKKKALLLCSVCGMILTSFFFSIGGLLALGIYGASKFTEKGIKEFLKNSVSLAGVLLHSAFVWDFAYSYGICTFGRGKAVHM